jgi:hypothetical protein
LSTFQQMWVKNGCWVSIMIIYPPISPLNRWISKQEYDESGPSIVHRKCF